MINKQNMVDISIIIPCYNQGVFLTEAIESIEKVNKDKFNIEIIIVNDGSSDSFTLDILNSSKMLSCRIINQPNKGLSSARNIGLRNANGKYIQFLDADDIIINDKFSKQLSFFEQNHNLGICVSSFKCSRVNINDVYNDVGTLSHSENKYPVEDFLFRWERGFTVPIHSALFRRDVCFVGDDFDETLRSKEDWYFWCKLVLQGTEFKFHDDVTAIYRIHDSSMCRDVSKSIIGFIMAQTKIYNIIKDDKLRNEFIQKSVEHFEASYLQIYQHQTLTIYNTSLSLKKEILYKIKTKLRVKLKQIKIVRELYWFIKHVKQKIVK